MEQSLTALARRRRFIVYTCGILACLVAAPRPSPANHTQPDVNPLIALLPQNERLNVIVVTRDGKTVSPTHALQVTAAQPVDVNQNTFADVSGAVYVGTYLQGKPLPAPAGSAPAVPESFLRDPGEQVYAQWQVPFDIRTGAMHGVRAKNGFVAERMQVSIPCNAAQMITTTGTNPITHQQGQVDAETSYIYVGGWGAGNSGVAVDAGLQKSSAQNPTDDYATYWKYGRNSPVTFTDRFPCNNNRYVTIELRPISATALAFTATGVGADNQPLTQTIIQITLSADGWGFYGTSTTNGVILKRMVTIAQPPTWHESGSAQLQNTWKQLAWFGVRQGGGPPLIRWRSCQVANAFSDGKPDYRAWGVEQTYYNSGMVQDFPRGAVLVKSLPSLCDLDAIDLRKSAI